MPDLYVKKSKTETLRPVKPDERLVGVEIREEVAKGDVRTKETREREREIKELAAYCPVPAGARFETQEQKEEIVLFLRAHPITNLRWIFIALLMGIAPFFAKIVPVFGFLPGRFYSVGILFWYLVLIAFVFEQFLNWYFNVYIVTDERIVDIDFLNLLYKKVSDAELAKIEDVTYTMGGVAKSIFNYGSVYIQTAAEVPEFEFVNVPRPDKVTAVIRTLMMQEEQETLEGRVR